MITQNDIQRLGLPTIEAYYQRIVDTRTNGNLPQANKLIRKLSQPQKKAFLEWFNEVHYSPEHYSGAVWGHTEYAYYTMIILS